MPTAGTAAPSWCSVRPRVVACGSRPLRRRFWLPAVARGGLGGVRIHDLRHTAVALWIATGANPNQISGRAGHTSVSFTLDRDRHPFEDADETLAGRLDSVYVRLE